VENPANPQYYYYRHDHLGDNREVWCANTNTVVQRTQYYPSGLPWAYDRTVDHPDLQHRKYNGKEFVEMHGYDTYDYGARGYYPAMGRFTSVDPLAENHYDVSPYAYCLNNPINYIDPLGLDTVASNNIPPTFDPNKDIVQLPEVTVKPKPDFQLTPNDQEWYKRHKEGLDQVNIEFAFVTAGTKPGLSLISWFWNNIINPPPPSTTLTFDANASRLVNGKQTDKIGKPKGNMPGNNQVQNKQIDNLARVYNLSKGQRNELHRLIGGEGYGYKEIEQLIKNYFNK